MSENSVRPFFQRYGLAIMAVAVAAWLRWLLTPIVGGTSPFILFYPTVALAAWYGGLKPGLLATALAGLLACLFLPPIGSLLVSNAGDMALLAIFVMIGVFISTLNESLHRAQRQAGQSVVELNETNERFHLLVESVVDYGISMLDAQGDIISWNRGGERICGYTSGEILGRHFSIFYPSEQIAGGRPQQELETAIKTGHFETGGWQVRKDGSRFWANVVITPIKTTTGELRGFSHVIQDLTASRKAEEERSQLLAKEQEARSESEAANLAKDEFLCVLSHELRTPLTSIIGWLSLLRRGVLPPEDTERALEAIERSAKVQARLVEDLLDASHMIAGKLSITPHPMQLGLAVRGAANAVGPAAEAKGVQLNIKADAAEAWVNGDAMRLEQVFSNLLSNAVKFTPSGGEVEVCMELQDSHVEVAVCDTGVGIDPNDLSLIFDRFRQGDSSETRQFSGLGLGLAIARYIVDTHGGTIYAESAGTGHGTVFMVRLPLLQSDMPASQK